MNEMLKPEVVSLIEAQTVPFVLIDRDYRIVGANQSYCDNYGMTLDQIVGKTCHEVSHRSATPCHHNGEDCPHQAVFRTGQTHEVMHTHFDQLNRPEYARIRGFPIHGEAGVRYLGEAVMHVTNPDEITCDDMRMVGSSPAFLHCVEMLARAGESDASVLLMGESGVGKELAAQYLHKRSLRRDKPFLAINCAAIPENMFEDELFGHERGAFTGCIGRKLGLFELADGGTLFLDEVGEIPLLLQAKLLRVLESGEFRRVGGTEVLRANVRIVAATNRNLLALADLGQYRLDLYYRIAGIDLRLPALRERRSDIPALADVMLRRISESSGQRHKLSDAAINKLLDYAFPGNVRELRNILVKAVAMCRNPVIGPEFVGLGHSAIPVVPNTVEPPVLPDHSIVQDPEHARMRDNISMADVEQAHIAQLLQIHGGHRRKVADILGISERTLYRKLKRFGIA